MADPQGADPDDGMARLRERLGATQRAAERLIEGIERGAGPPPGGGEPHAAPFAPPGGGEPRAAPFAPPGGGEPRAAPFAPPGDVPGDVPGDDARAGRTEPRPPPAGYAVPDPGPTTGTLDELAALVRMVRALVPDELARELGELARELLLLLRALIDWLVGRLEPERVQPVTVTDIPIA